MKLYCPDCDETFPDYAARNTPSTGYKSLCPECDAELEEFVEPLDRLSFVYSGDAGDFMFSLPDTTPAEQLAVSEGTLMRRQAGAK